MSTIANSETVAGTIIEIQRWSVADGPGSRTVVFLKGCPLHCPWCANPESQDHRPQIGLFPSRCVTCGACTRECPENIALPVMGGAFSKSGCKQCGKCIPACHAEARSWMGRQMTVDQVIQTLKKDRVFYRRSQGGVTFSGGEPLTQPQFLESLVDACQQLGIHTAIETCGFFQWHTAEKVMRKIDLVMFDIKHMDTREHKKLTGVSNALILENAKMTAALGIPMIIRIPVIPSLNDSQQNIRATAEFVRKSLPGALGIELLPYHKLGLSKYEAIGADYPLDGIDPPDEAHMAELWHLVDGTGVALISAEKPV